MADEEIIIVRPADFAAVARRVTALVATGSNGLLIARDTKGPHTSGHCANWSDKGYYLHSCAILDQQS